MLEIGRSGKAIVLELLSKNSRKPTIYIHVRCSTPAGLAPLRMVVAVVIGIAGAIQLECACQRIGIGSAPEEARTQEPAQERWRVVIGLWE
jgi:hypothetical protein